MFIIGTRGIPAAHGGFETFAERFSLHMRDAGWQVTVYGQSDHHSSEPAIVDEWQGIRRIIFSAKAGAIGTMVADWNAVRHASRQRGVMLVLGYNTAVFSALLRTKKLPLITNMDGIEWKRAKWPLHGRIWLYLNEWIGALTSTKLIADHPEIAKHLASRRSQRDIVMIPYGADAVENAPDHFVRGLKIEPQRYFLSIGRIEPENNILPMVRAYVSAAREFAFVCLGKFEAGNVYHQEVLQAGKGRVIFPGPIYDVDNVQALRFHAAAYCHGHSVGGTNPSLVEALGAGNPVIAHDNKYNRWVAGEDQFYFSDTESASIIFDRLERDEKRRREAGLAALARHAAMFRWDPVMRAYEDLCCELAPVEDRDDEVAPR